MNDKEMALLYISMLYFSIEFGLLLCVQLHLQLVYLSLWTTVHHVVFFYVWHSGLQLLNAGFVKRQCHGNAICANAKLVYLTGEQYWVSMHHQLTRPKLIPASIYRHDALYDGAALDRLQSTSWSLSVCLRTTALPKWSSSVKCMDFSYASLGEKTHCDKDTWHSQSQQCACF